MPSTKSNSNNSKPSTDADNSNSHSEREASFSTPPRGTKAEQRAWAIRRYYGIGEDGRLIEEMTQQEIADALGVSRQTVNRWVNEEPLPLVEGWSYRERMTLFAITVSGDEDTLEEYLFLQRLLKSDSRSAPCNRSRILSEQSAEPESDPHLFDGFDLDFNPW